LCVFIEAPTEAIEGIIQAHEKVRNLCDNGWIHLYTLDDDGRPAYRYAGDLNWEATPLT
jgi:uncharacterized protein YbcC (UPF0753/DUF2309 family)